MKRVVSLLLAVLMFAGMLSVFATAVAAQGDASDTTAPTSTYVVYDEDFNLGRDAEGWSSDEVLSALGWYIPDAKADRNIAAYQIVDKGDQDRALRVSTHLNDVGGFMENSIESFVTVFGGDLMSIVREGNFTISYDLTYRTGTKNTNGYSAMIYNYNEKDGLENGEAYGIVAVRACGTGLNSIYSPLSGDFGSVECPQNEGEFVMSNRYQQFGQYESLYSRIARTFDHMDYVESEPLVGKDLLIDKPLHVQMNYEYSKGMSVRINNVLVSTPNVDIYANGDTTVYSGLWKHFMEGSTGASVGFVTTENVIADIDNLKITAEQLGTDSADQLPELLITELCARPDINTGWADFLEIYNPTDKPVDLKEYSVMYSWFSETTVEDIIQPTRATDKFTLYGSLADVFGKKSVSDAFYVEKGALERYEEGVHYQHVDNNVNNKYFVADPNNSSAYIAVPNAVELKKNFTHYRVNMIENWNTRYDVNNPNDTYLQPGECILLFMTKKSTVDAYLNGVNGGVQSDTFNAQNNNFRNLYRKMGLSKETKVLFCDWGEMVQNPRNSNRGGYRYYLAKTNDDQGQRIPYGQFYTYDKRIDPYIVCYVDYCAPLVEGWLDEANGNNPDHAHFGEGGVTHRNRAWGVSGVYIYGVDASRDARCGTLYSNRNLVKDGAVAHVGCLSGAQEIIMKDMYAKALSDSIAPLSITEIAPNTNNLAGEAKRAFTAMELTNTSSKRIDLYDYSLVRTELDQKCTLGMGFSYFTKMRAGNPVDKTDTNNSYYYFAQEHLSNPETCILQPGETVVVWFLTKDTYSSYSRDDAFGFDYFRQYWVNQGNTQLAVKSSDGGYATKVIAVDANIDTTFNGGNTEFLFELSAKESAIYGIAENTEAVFKGDIYSKDVISVAMFGSAFCYYKMEYGPAVSPTTGETWYALILKRDIPVNTTMRYIVGGAFNSRCSALSKSVKSIRYYQIKKYTQFSQVPLPVDQWAYRFDCTDAHMEARLGTLDGREALAILDHLFVKETSDKGEVTYRYFDAVRTNVITLQGAAVKATGSKPMLRFDNAISNEIYSSLVATYGDKVKFGTLIVKTDLLGDMKTFDKESLHNAGITADKYDDKACELIYRNAEHAVLSASIEVDDVNTNYTAIGYIEVALHDGTTLKTVYSAESVTRNVKEVAIAAINDVSSQQDNVYRYTSINSDDINTQYSPYSDEMQRKLSEYVGL